MIYTYKVEEEPGVSRPKTVEKLSGDPSQLYASSFSVKFITTTHTERAGKGGDLQL